MFWSIRHEPGDGPRLIMVLEECGSPTITPTDEVLGPLDSGFELWQLIVLRRGLEFVRALAYVHDILEHHVSERA